MLITPTLGLEAVPRNRGLPITGSQSPGPNQTKQNKTSSDISIEIRDMIKNIKENFDEKPKFIKKMCKIPNMDVNPIIKMFDHLREKNSRS